MIEKYVLYGLVNIFGVVPDFVLPVYVKDGILYVQEGENGLGTGMLKIDDDLKERVIRLSPNSLKRMARNHRAVGLRILFGEEKKDFTPYFCFQEDDKNFVFGTKEDLSIFFNGYRTESQRIMREIKAFREDNPLEKLKVKVEYRWISTPVYNYPRGNIYIKNCCLTGNAYNYRLRNRTTVYSERIAKKHTNNRKSSIGKKANY